MSSLSFSLEGYKKDCLLLPPEVLCPYFNIDPILYHQLEKKNKERKARGDLNIAFQELKKRTGPDRFRNTYPIQTRTLDYSVQAFPAYRFILPEVMSEDWLAIVDWGKFQRDHVLHQPLCGYVLLKLLKMPINGETFLDRIVKFITEDEKLQYIRDSLKNMGMKENHVLLKNDELAKQLWKVIFEEAAYIAAVFHDLGYPWQYAERMRGNLDGINTPLLDDFQNTSQIVKTFGNRLLFYPFNGYKKPNIACPSTWEKRLRELTEKSLQNTHGFVGALGFLHLNDCIRKYPSEQESSIHLLCVEWIATAIMMHNMKDIYWGNKPNGIPENPFLRLSFDKDPLSSIITLVDILQDFERPSVSYGVRGKTVTMEYKSACTKTEITIDDNRLIIEYFMKTPEDLVIKRMSLPKEQFEYFDPRYGYLDLSSIGIHSVEMRASMAAEELENNVTVNLQSKRTFHGVILSGSVDGTFGMMSKDGDEYPSPFSLFSF